MSYIYKIWHRIFKSHLIYYYESSASRLNGIKIARPNKDGVLEVNFNIRGRMNPKYKGRLTNDCKVIHTNGYGTQWVGGSWYYLDIERKFEQFLKVG